MKSLLHIYILKRKTSAANHGHMVGKFERPEKLTTPTWLVTLKD